MSLKKSHEVERFSKAIAEVMAENKLTQVMIMAVDFQVTVMHVASFESSSLLWEVLL